jgi:hypothetical protein
MKKGGDSNIEMDVYSSRIEAITKKKIEDYNNLLKKLQVYK